MRNSSSIVPPVALAPGTPLQPVALEPSGHHSPGRLLAGLLPWIARGGRIYCVDGGNVFDPYLLIEWATREGLDPREILERVFVSRAYTCHQIVAAVETLLGAVALSTPFSLGLVLQVDRLFHDENLPRHERAYLFDRMTRSFANLCSGGFPLLLTVDPVLPNPWKQRLVRVATFSGDIDRYLSGGEE